MSTTEDTPHHDDISSDMLRSPVELCCDESSIEEHPVLSYEPQEEYPQASLEDVTSSMNYYNSSVTPTVELNTVIEPIIVHYVSDDDEDDDDNDSDDYHNTCRSPMLCAPPSGDVTPPSSAGSLAAIPLSDDASAEAAFQHLVNYIIRAYRVAQHANSLEDYISARQRCLNLSSQFIGLADACARRVEKMDEAYQHLTTRPLTQPPPSQKPAHQQAKRPRSARLAARSARRLAFF